LGCNFKAMTSSINLKKLVSVSAALLLAIGGTLSGAVPAQATPLVNAKKMGYNMAWLPGQTLETTFASPSVGFNSGLRMDDVTALRGTTLTVSSVNTGLATGTLLMDYAYIQFFANTADRNAGYPAIGSGAQINNTQSSSLTVPQTAVAMSISYVTRFNGDASRPLAVGSYTSTPRVFSNGNAVTISTASSGSSLYTSYSYASVDGATQAFTTPSSGTVNSTSYYVLGCIDSSLLTSSTTYTADLKINGVSASSSFTVSLLTGTSGNMNEVRGSSNSFGSGQLSTWRQSAAPLQVLAEVYSDTSHAALGTQYDATLEFKDSSNQSLLKDCAPTTPNGTGAFSFSTTGNTGMLSFTPDATLGASQWQVNVYSAADDSLLTYASGRNASASMVPARYTGGMGMPSWAAGTVVYARAVSTLTLLGTQITSPLGTASANFTIPSYGGSSAPSVVAPSASLARPLTPEQAKNQIKPLPTIVQPLVAALPALNKPLVEAGGKVDLKTGDFTGLVSASISGKALDLKVGATGSLSITVPTGKAGTTADLLLNFTSGTVILQDAIKYVAPVVVANIPVRPVAIKSGAKALSPAAADAVRQAAFANLKNNSIECVAYAASAATADAAKATAQQACDLAVKSNPDLVNTNVVVVIDKTKAATQGVGIKVYKK
jgi:hypothetical protein